MKLTSAQHLKLQLLHNEYLELYEEWFKFTYDFSTIINVLRRLQYIQERAVAIYREVQEQRNEHNGNAKPGCNLFSMFRSYSDQRFNVLLTRAINQCVYGSSTPLELVNDQVKNPYIMSISVSINPDVYCINFSHGKVIKCQQPNADNLLNFREIFEYEMVNAKRLNVCLTLAEAHL